MSVARLMSLFLSFIFISNLLLINTIDERFRMYSEAFFAGSSLYLYLNVIPALLRHEKLKLDLNHKIVLFILIIFGITV